MSLTIAFPGHEKLVHSEIYVWKEKKNNAPCKIAIVIVLSFEMLNSLGYDTQEYWDPAVVITTTMLYWLQVR